jgi:hypothetical protein
MSWHVYGLETASVQNCQLCTVVFPESTFTKLVQVQTKVQNQTFTSLLMISNVSKKKQRLDLVGLALLHETLDSFRKTQEEPSSLNVKSGTIFMNISNTTIHSYSKDQYCTGDFFSFSVMILCPSIIHI